MWWLMYSVNLFCLLCVLLPIPLYCLSAFFAWKKKPLIGGALAFVKLFATIRVTSELWAVLWDKRVAETGWRLFSAGHTPASVAFFSAMLVMGVVCLFLNGCVLVRKAAGPAPAAQV